MHLAQLNVGRLKAPIDDPMIDDFRTNLARINSLAEASPGYVWRLQDESGDATSIKPFGDELEIINLTVWESIEALADFTYRSGHVELLRRRREFFEAPASRSCACGGFPRGRSPPWRKPSPASTTYERTGLLPAPSLSAIGSSLAPSDAQVGSRPRRLSRVVDRVRCCEGLRPRRYSPVRQSTRGLGSGSPLFDA